MNAFHMLCYYTYNLKKIHYDLKLLITSYMSNAILIIFPSLRYCVINFY